MRPEFPAKQGRIASLLIVSICSLLGGPAAAHVKWFCASADVHEVPKAIETVVTPTFLAGFALFASLVFLGFLIDGMAERRWPSLASCGTRFDAVEERLVRVAIGAYFLLLWDKGAVAAWDEGSRVLLTPELAVARPWIGSAQFIVAVAVTTRPSCVLAAIGILALYVDGIRKFGIFHMTDYVFFPGIAVYLALVSFATPATVRWRVPILSGSLAFGLMWTAIEKLVYPQWTLQIVANHPELAFGFSPRFTVTMAAFVEFTLAYFIMTGRGLVRFGALGYALIFIGAIPTFGHLDAVGHIPIVGILLAVCLHGCSPLQEVMGIHGLGRVRNAAAIAGVYAVTLGMFFVMYYGLHMAEYGTPASMLRLVVGGR